MLPVVASETFPGVCQFQCRWTKEVSVSYLWKFCVFSTWWKSILLVVKSDFTSTFNTHTHHQSYQKRWNTSRVKFWAEFKIFVKNFFRGFFGFQKSIWKKSGIQIFAGENFRPNFWNLRIKKPRCTKFCGCWICIVCTICTAKGTQEIPWTESLGINT